MFGKEQFKSRDRNQSVLKETSPLFVFLFFLQFVRKTDYLLSRLVENRLNQQALTIQSVII